jgi:hypothetical protein
VLPGAFRVSNDDPSKPYVPGSNLPDPSSFNATGVPAAGPPSGQPPTGMAAEGARDRTNNRKAGLGLAGAAAILTGSAAVGVAAGSAAGIFDWFGDDEKPSGNVATDERGPSPFATQSATAPSSEAIVPEPDSPASPSASAGTPSPAVALPGNIIPMEAPGTDAKRPEHGTFLGVGFDEDGDIALFQFKNGRWREVENISDGYIQHIHGGERLLGLDQYDPLTAVWFNAGDPHNSDEAQHFHVFHGDGTKAEFKLSFRVKDGKKQMIGVSEQNWYNPKANNGEGKNVEWSKSGALPFGVPSVGPGAPKVIRDDEMRTDLGYQVSVGDAHGQAAGPATFALALV